MSSNNSSCSSSPSSLFFYCISMRRVSSWVFHIGLIYSCGYSKKTELTFGQWRKIVSWGGAVLDVSVFLLNDLGRDTFLWMLRRSCYLDEFFFMNNVTMKGQLSSFPSCCIKNFLITLLLSPHLSQYSFRYGIDMVLGLW